MQYQRLAVGVALAAAIGLTGCGGGGSHQQRGPLPLNVDVAQAQRHDIATYVTLDGQVAPLLQSTISFQQSGPVVAMYAVEGDRVSKGQLLAKIDDSTFRAQLAQDEALIAQAQAKANSSTLNVPVTQAQTAAAEETAKAALENAKLNYNQNAQLYKQGYVSLAQLEASRAAYVQAEQTYQQMQAQRLNTRISQANAQADVANVKAVQAQANTLRTQIAQTSLYAPYNGVVTARLVDPGAVVGPSSQVYGLSKVDTVYVNVNVPDEDLAYVRPGTPVTFTSDTLGSSKKFAGRVETVNAIPTQGTLSYRARLVQPNPGDLLRGGMLVSITIEKAKHPGAIVVPRTAIAQTDQGASVFIVSAGKAEQVPVQLGLQTDTLAEVISPKIQPGMEVITTRPDALQNGSVVAVNGANGPGGPGGPNAASTTGPKHRQ
ncbi:MAG: efflux RND transporter periplasmic adaptor subunit [Vulcanimicrobiaceae bacterium]